MAEKGNVTNEVIERLISRIDGLEKKLEQSEAKNKEEKKDKSTTKKVTDTITDATGDFFKESGKILRGTVDASIETIKEAANALSSMSDETDRENMADIPAAFVSVLRRTADIQKKVIDKFEESYKKGKDD
jgi:serine/threonine-protein kinase RIO1